MNPFEDSGNCFLLVPEILTSTQWIMLNIYNLLVT